MFEPLHTWWKVMVLVDLQLVLYNSVVLNLIQVTGTLLITWDLHLTYKWHLNEWYLVRNLAWLSINLTFYLSQLTQLLGEKGSYIKIFEHCFMLLQCSDRKKLTCGILKCCMVKLSWIFISIYIIYRDLVLYIFKTVFNFF